MLDARWNTLGPTYAFGEGRRKMTRSQFARFFDEHADELRDALLRGRKYARRSSNLLSDNVCALLWLEFSKISRSDADIFFVRFSEGSNLGGRRSDPRAASRANQGEDAQGGGIAVFDPVQGGVDDQGVEQVPSGPARAQPVVEAGRRGERTVPTAILTGRTATVMEGWLEYERCQRAAC